jgi:NADH dehydrogenase [ubiquinone] 1 alpha subcomplex assembly factor 7
VHLVETSEAMRATQKEHLTHRNRPNVSLHWHNSIKEIPRSATEYTMLVAHEFFDALPIHIIQVHLSVKQRCYNANVVIQKAETGQWHEVLVATNVEQDTNVESGSKTPTAYTSSFRYVLAPQPTTISTLLSMSSPRFKDLPAGSSLEVSPTSFRIGRQVGELLSSAKGETLGLGGCGMIIDYGGNKAFDNSFRVRVISVFEN